MSEAGGGDEVGVRWSLGGGEALRSRVPLAAVKRGREEADAGAWGGAGEEDEAEEARRQKRLRGEGSSDEEEYYDEDGEINSAYYESEGDGERAPSAKRRRTPRTPRSSSSSSSAAAAAAGSRPGLLSADGRDIVWPEEASLYAHPRHLAARYLVDTDPHMGRGIAEIVNLSYGQWPPQGPRHFPAMDAVATKVGLPPTCDGPFEEEGAEEEQEERAQVKEEGGGKAEVKKESKAEADAGAGADDTASVTRDAGMILPSRCRWFSLDSVHMIEKRGVPEFFSRKYRRGPTMYRRTRNLIVEAYRANPRAHLSLRAARSLVAGDATAVAAIYNLLDSWGVINSHCLPGCLPMHTSVSDVSNPNRQPAAATRFSVHADDPFRGISSWGAAPCGGGGGGGNDPEAQPGAGLDTAAYGALPPRAAHAPAEASPPKRATNEKLRVLADDAAEDASLVLLQRRLALGATTMRRRLPVRQPGPGHAVEPVLGPSRPAPVPVECRACGVPCPEQSYACRQVDAFALCCRCFVAGRYPSAMQAADFKLVSIRRGGRGVRGGDGGGGGGGDDSSWTREETNRLLEALSRYGADWERVAEHVHTQSKDECMMQFVRLPLQDEFLALHDYNLGVSLERPVPSSFVSPAEGEDPLPEPNFEGAARLFRGTDNPPMALAAFVARYISPELGSAVARGCLGAYMDAEKLALLDLVGDERRVLIDTKYGSGYLLGPEAGGEGDGGGDGSGGGDGGGGGEGGVSAMDVDEKPSAAAAAAAAPAAEARLASDAAGTAGTADAKAKVKEEEGAQQPAGQLAAVFAELRRRPFVKVRFPWGVAHMRPASVLYEGSGLPRVSVSVVDHGKVMAGGLAAMCERAKLMSEDNGRKSMHVLMELMRVAVKRAQLRAEDMTKIDEWLAAAEKAHMATMQAIFAERIGIAAIRADLLPKAASSSAAGAAAAPPAAVASGAAPAGQQ